MSESKSDHVFVTELDKLFFEIGQKMASFKTPEEQRLFLKGILEKLEKRNDLGPWGNDSEETQGQLSRHYKKSFVYWALTQEKLITNEVVKQKGGKLLWYDKENKRHKEFTLPHNLRAEFQNGWNSVVKKCA